MLKHFNIRGPANWAPFPWPTVLHCLGFAVVAGIVSGYGHYFPPDFKNGFLRDKADYFYNSPYCLAFYSHIIACPIAILVGAPQFWLSLRRSRPLLHRRLGYMYVCLVIVFCAPGGLIMAWGTNWGVAVELCFVALSCLTWFATYVSWRAATQRKFLKHERWMTRSYILMCSAIILRLTDLPLRRLGLDPVTSYNVCVWVSWVAPLIAYELCRRTPKAHHRPATDSSIQE